MTFAINVLPLNLLLCWLAALSLVVRRHNPSLPLVPLKRNFWLQSLLPNMQSIQYLRAVLHEPGFSQRAPTLVFEDNMSAINMINVRVPTERSHHIDIQYFAIQDWKDRGDIIMRHVPGTIHPSDDLTKRSRHHSPK